MADADALASIAQQIDLVRQDAREARDGMMKLTAAVEGQDVSQKVADLSTEMKAQHAALRQDVVLAINNVNKDLSLQDGRIKVLEDAEERREGGLAVIRVMKDYGGWFIGMGAAAMAVYEKFAMKP